MICGRKQRGQRKHTNRHWRGQSVLDWKVERYAFVFCLFVCFTMALMVSIAKPCQTALPQPNYKSKCKLWAIITKKREKSCYYHYITEVDWRKHALMHDNTTPTSTAGVQWATACREELHIPTLLHGADDKRLTIWKKCKVWFGRLEEAQSTDRWSVLVLNQTESLSSATLAATNPLRHFSKPKC